MQLTPEQVRFHAAGHLAAASALVAAGHMDAAKIILNIVDDYIADPKVNAPPQLKDRKLITLIGTEHVFRDIVTIESMFVDPFNTRMELS